MDGGLLLCKIHRSCVIAFYVCIWMTLSRKYATITKKKKYEAITVNQRRSKSLIVVLRCQAYCHFEALYEFLRHHCFHAAVMVY